MHKYSPWDEEDLAKLKDLASHNVSIEDICKELNRSKISITNKLKNIDVDSSNITEEDSSTTNTPREKRTIIEKAAINFLDMRLKERNYNDVWSSILDFQHVLEEKSIEQTEAKIRINTKSWIGVAFIGDLHIGNMATDYKTMLEHRDLIASTENLYVTFNGDYCDNFLPTSHASGMFEALFPPAVQKQLAKDYIETIKDKVIALVSGCHDTFGQKASDFDLTEYLAKHGEAVYLGNGGTLWLTIGKITYKVVMRHKYRFNSSDNPTATVKKMFEKMGGFDLGVISHSHIASMEECVKESMDGNLKRLFIRAGTYKTHDRYGKELGFSEGDISVPIVLFSPDKRDIRGFQDISEGLEYLLYLNRKDNVIQKSKKSRGI